MSDTVTAYWQALLRRLPLLLLLSFLAGAIAYGISSSVAPVHVVHFSYLVSLSQREAASDFRFDGYYALQATDLFASTLAKWIQTPEVISTAHQEAGLKLSSTDPRTIRRMVNAEKTAPQLVEVTIRDADSARAEQLGEGLRTVMEKNIALYHDQGIPALTFRAVPTASWTGKPAVATNVITIATFIFALFISINVVLFRESLRT